MALPELLMVSEGSLTPGLDLFALRAAMPDVRLRLLIRPDWYELALEAQAAALQIWPMVAPLTPMPALKTARPAWPQAWTA